MTDLWVFDYMNGVCVQSLHQTNEDADWGIPKMSLQYGGHHVYFVASRGGVPSLNDEEHLLTWDTTRDTFWKDYEVNVVSTSNGNRAVTLDRVATKIVVSVNDEVPAECVTVTVIPERWYYGLDYVTGEAVSVQKKSRTVTVPASVIGTSGKLSITIFGLSGADEWTTNIGIQARNVKGEVIGAATIVDAPFKRNRSTEYNGNLFGSCGGLDVSVNDEWEQSKAGTW